MKLGLKILSLLSCLSYSAGAGVNMVFQEAFLIKKEETGRIKLVESSDEGVFVAGESKDGLYFGKLKKDGLDWSVSVSQKIEKELNFLSLSVYDNSLVAVGNFNDNLTFTGEGDGFGTFELTYQKDKSNYFVVGLSDDSEKEVFFIDNLTIDNISSQNSRVISSSIDEEKTIYLSSSFDGHLSLGEKDIDGDEKSQSQVSFLVSITKDSVDFAVLQESSCEKALCKVEGQIYTFGESKHSSNIESDEEPKITAKCVKGTYFINERKCSTPFCAPNYCVVGDTPVPVFPLNYGESDILENTDIVVKCDNGTLFVDGEVCVEATCPQTKCVYEGKVYTFKETPYLESSPSEEDELIVGSCDDEDGLFYIDRYNECKEPRYCPESRCTIGSKILTFNESLFDTDIKSNEDESVIASCVDEELFINDQKCVEPEEPPTQAPTDAPTQEPTQAPTDAPTQAPTDAPTQAPTESPTPTATETATATVTATATTTLTSTPTELTNNNSRDSSTYKDPPSSFLPNQRKKSSFEKRSESVTYEPTQMKILKDGKDVKLIICSDSAIENTYEFNIDLFVDKKPPQVSLLKATSLKSPAHGSIFPTKSHLYFAGIFKEDIKIKETKLKVEDEAYGIFYGKIDYSGKLAWAGKISNIGKFESTPFVPIAVSCNQECQLFIGGPSTNKTTIGSLAIKEWPTNLGFIASIDDAGQPLWIDEVFQNAQHGVVEDLAVYLGKIYVGGTIKGEKLKFNWISVEDAQEPTAFIAVIGPQKESEPTDAQPTEYIEEGANLLPISLAIGITVLCVAFVCWKLSKKRGKTFRRKGGYNRVEAYEMDPRDDVTIFAVDDR